MDYSVLGIDEGQFVSLSDVLQIFDENISIDTNFLNYRQGLITNHVFILVSRCRRVFRRNGWSWKNCNNCCIRWNISTAGEYCRQLL